MHLPLGRPRELTYVQYATPTGGVPTSGAVKTRTGGLMHLPLGRPRELTYVQYATLTGAPQS